MIELWTFCRLCQLVDEEFSFFYEWFHSNLFVCLFCSGIGTKLLEHVLSICEKDGDFDSIFLHVQVRESDDGGDRDVDGVVTVSLDVLWCVVRKMNTMIIWCTFRKMNSQLSFVAAALLRDRTMLSFTQHPVLRRYHPDALIGFHLSLSPFL